MSSTKSASAPNVIFNESPSAQATVAALEHEAAAARAAMSGAMADLQHHLQTAADPREWAQRRPWMALGVAAAAGFVAAGMFTRERRQPYMNGTAHPAAVQPAPAAASGPSWTSLVLDLVRVVLTSQLLPMVQAWMQSSAGRYAAGDGGASNGAADAPPPDASMA